MFAYRLSANYLTTAHTRSSSREPKWSRLQRPDPCIPKCSQSAMRSESFPAIFRAREASSHSAHLPITKTKDRKAVLSDPQRLTPSMDKGIAWPSRPQQSQLRVYRVSRWCFTRVASTNNAESRSSALVQRLLESLILMRSTSPSFIYLARERVVLALLADLHSSCPWENFYF